MFLNSLQELTATFIRIVMCQEGALVKILNVYQVVACVMIIPMKTTTAIHAMTSLLKVIYCIR